MTANVMQPRNERVAETAGASHAEAERPHGRSQLRGQDYQAGVAALRPPGPGGRPTEAAAGVDEVPVTPLAGVEEVEEVAQAPEGFFDFLFRKGRTKGEGGGGDAKPAKTSGGLSAKVSIGRFVSTARDVERTWSKLTPKQRGSKLGEAANAELQLAGVPKTAIDLRTLGGGTLGQLQFTRWALELNESSYAPATVDKSTMARVADTIYHEARHAEQWHQMARLQAGKGKSPRQIARSMSIPVKIAKDAASKPIKSGDGEAQQATAWFESVYGAKAKARNRTLSDLHKLGHAFRQAHQRAEAARQAYHAASGAAARRKAKVEWDAAKRAYDEARKKYQEVYKAYRALPEEQDAWAVGGSAGKAYERSR